MFNIVEKNQKLVKGIMIVVIASFVLWGIGSYLGMMGDDGYVAKVGSEKIYSRDIDNVMQQNKQYTDKMQVLFSLINRQLLLDNAKSYNMNATTTQLQTEIANIPAFQESGVFSLTKYEEFLRNSQQTANQFQHNVAQQIVINQMVDGFKNSYFNSRIFDDKFAQLLSQERNVSTYTIDPKSFYSQINITDKQIADYYNQNIAKFTLPEQVKVEYITLSPETVQASIILPESVVTQYIKSHESQLANTQVDVSHILFTVPDNADAKTRATIKAKAEQVLGMVKANPSQFSELAKKYSEDPGSAKNGGDLGYFGHGAMVPPFEKVAFSLKPNQISGLVKTQFGYHILKLNSIKKATPDEIRTTAITQLKKDQTTGAIAHKLDILNDLTYNKPNSLEPAAKALNLAIESSSWVKKTAITTATNANTDQFSNPKVQKAIFSDDVIKKHNNSEVVDFGNNVYTVYRVVDHKISVIEPISSVRTAIIDSLKQQQAIQMANKEATEDIAKLSQGKLKLDFVGSDNVNLLSQNSNISPMAVKQIFSTNLAKLPAYTTGIDLNGGVVIYRINKESINQGMIAQNKSMLQQYSANNAMVDFGIYVSSLRAKFPVSYRADRLTQNNDASNAPQQ